MWENEHPRLSLTGVSFFCTTHIFSLLLKLGNRAEGVVNVDSSRHLFFAKIMLFILCVQAINQKELVSTFINSNKKSQGTSRK
jgi:hypothetical protein